MKYLTAFFVIICLFTGSAQAAIADDVEQGAERLLKLLGRLTEVCKTSVMLPKRIYVANKLDEMHQQLWKLEYEKRYVLGEMARSDANWENMHTAILEVKQRLEKSSNTVERFGAYIQQYDNVSGSLAGDLADVLSGKRGAWVNEAEEAIAAKDSSRLPHLRESGKVAVGKLAKANKALAQLVIDLRK